MYVLSDWDTQWGHCSELNKIRCMPGNLRGKWLRIMALWRAAQEILKGWNQCRWIEGWPAAVRCSVAVSINVHRTNLSRKPIYAQTQLIQKPNMQRHNVRRTQRTQGHNVRKSPITQKCKIRPQVWYVPGNWRGNDRPGNEAQWENDIAESSDIDSNSASSDQNDCHMAKSGYSFYLYMLILHIWCIFSHFQPPNELGI